MAKKTRSVFPEGTETSLPARQHRLKWGWGLPATRGIGGQAGELLPCPRAVRHGPGSAPGGGCPVRQRMNREVFAHIYLDGSTPGFPGLALGGSPSLRLLLLGHGLDSLSPAAGPGQPVCFGAGGQTRPPWEAHPGLQGPKPVVTPHPPKTGPRQKHQAISGPSRGLRSVELSQHRRAKTPFEGVGATGTQFPLVPARILQPG